MPIKYINWQKRKKKKKPEVEQENGRLLWIVSVVKVKFKKFPTLTNLAQ